MAVEEPRQRHRNRILRLSGWLAILFWCIVSALFVALASGTALSAIVVVPFVLLAPGATVALLMRFQGIVLPATIVILTGMAIGVLTPSAFLYAHAWSPSTSFAVVTVGTFATAVAGIAADRRRDSI